MKPKECWACSTIVNSERYEDHAYWHSELKQKLEEYEFKINDLEQQIKEHNDCLGKIIEVFEGHKHSLYNLPQKPY